MILAVDVGYGYTKYAYQDKLSKFPSAVAHIPALTGFGETSTYTYNGSYYLVGENARLSETIPTRTENFLVKYSPLLLYHLFKKEGLKSVDTLCVSLSIAEFREKKDDLEEVCKVFTVNNEVYRQKEVVVFPQGLGIWITSGAPKDAIIVDIGFNTLDVLTIIDSKPRPEYSFSLSNMGVGNIIDAINDWVNSHFPGNSLSPHMADEILLNGGKFKIFRKQYDLSDFIEEQKRLFADDVISSVLSASKLKKVLLSIDEFIIAGGGAYYIPQEVADKHGFYIPENPEYANVKGFLIAAQSEESEG